MKRTTTTPLPAQPCGGRGKWGCYLYGPEDLLFIKLFIKICFLLSELHLNYHQKHTENVIFNENL
jgi:hypothetical protein